VNTVPEAFLAAEPEHWFAVLDTPQRMVGSYDGRPRTAKEGEGAKVVVVEPGGDLDVFVSEYGADYGYIQQFWFRNREEAASFAVEEYGDTLVEWIPIPADESDPERFALTSASERES
jgi:hypothetical protein